MPPCYPAALLPCGDYNHDRYGGYIVNGLTKASENLTYLPGVPNPTGKVSLEALVLANSTGTHAGPAFLSLLHNSWATMLRQDYAGARSLPMNASTVRCSLLPAAGGILGQDDARVAVGEWFGSLTLGRRSAHSECVCMLERPGLWGRRCAAPHNAFFLFFFFTLLGFVPPRRLAPCDLPPQATAAIATYSEPFISSVLSTAVTNAIQGLTTSLFAVIAMYVQRLRVSLSGKAHAHPATAHAENCVLLAFKQRASFERFGSPFFSAENGC